MAPWQDDVEPFDAADLKEEDEEPDATPPSSPSTERPLVLRVAGEQRTAPAIGMVRSPGLGARVGKAAMTLLGSLVLAALFLPIPLMHLAGIPIVLAGIFFAARSLRGSTVLRAAHGTCPACGEETSLFVGFGGTPYRLPLTTSCEHCARELILEDR